MHPRRGLTLTELIVTVVLLVIVILVMGRVERNRKAAHYRRSAASNGRHLDRCWEIVALTPEERHRQIAQGADNPLDLLTNPDRARRLIPYFAQRRDHDLWQADHLDDPAPPEPHCPD